MIRETIQIELNKNFKDKAMNIIDETIEDIAQKKDYTITDDEKRKIRNLSLDQVSVNVSSRARSKTLWVFNSEGAIPIIVEKDLGVPKMGSLVNKEKTGCSYKMKPNLTWTYNKNNTEKGGINYDEFESRVLEMLLEDIETATFYGALSHVTESDEM